MFELILWRGELVRGLINTLELSFLAYGLGLVLGAAGSAALVWRTPLLTVFVELYAAVFRGVPELLVIFLVFYGAPVILQYIGSTFGLQDRIEVSPFVAGVVALGLVQGAYISQVLRGAIVSIPRGQMDAARSLGLGTRLTFFKVLLPQAARYALPGLSNCWLALLKETALISVIGSEDLIRKADIAIGVTQLPFTFYGAVAFAYLALTIASIFAIARFKAWANWGVWAS